MNRLLQNVTALNWMTGLLLTMSTISYAQQHAHSHGRLTLNVAVDAKAITLQMEGPLDNFLGFERAPRNEAERKQVTVMVKSLNEPDKLLLLDPRAGCTLSNVQLESAVLGLGKKSMPAQSTSSTGEKVSEEHAAIDVEIVFTCTKPEAARFIEVKLFDAFKLVRNIDAQVASSQGQFKRTLTNAASKLTWGK